MLCAHCSLFLLYSFPQSGNALVVKLLQRNQQQREKEHPPHTPYSPTQIYGKKGGKRVQAYLVAEKLCLNAASHQRYDSSAYGKPQASGEVANQQGIDSPRYKHYSHAEYRQSIYNRGNGGHAHSSLYTQKYKRNNQFKKGDKH